MTFSKGSGITLAPSVTLMPMTAQSHLGVWDFSSPKLTFELAGIENETGPVEIEVNLLR